MITALILDGRPYVISKQFAWHIANGLATLTFDTRDVQSDITALLNTSNERTLSKDEADRLANLTHVANVANTIRVVGAHHDPVKEWGFDGWDAVHGNHATLHCGCILHHVFDYHSAANHFGHNRLSEEQVTGPDGTVKTVMHYEREHHVVEPRRSCVLHIHLSEDAPTHYAQAVADHKFIDTMCALAAFMRE